MRLAGQTDNPKIPFILSLSSWKEHHKTLDNWIRGELDRFYNITPANNYATKWLADDRLILLLDGLDEVPPSEQNSCLTALNQFRADHVNTGIVVACRFKDYVNMPQKLNLGWAVELQPLTDAQFNSFFQRAKPELENIQKKITGNERLKKLAASPMLLNILATVYQDQTEIDLDEIRIGPNGELPPELIEKYIHQMVTQRGKRCNFPPDKTIQWLGVLARRVKEANFLLEDIQPDWLEKSTHKWAYWTGLATLTLTPILFLSLRWVTVAVYTFFFGEDVPYVLSHYQLNFTPYFALSFLWIMWRMLRKKFGAVYASIAGILFGITIAMGIGDPANDFIFSLFGGLGIGGAVGLGLWWFGNRQLTKRNQDIPDIDPIVLRKFEWRQFLGGLGFGSFVGLLAYLIIAFTIINNRHGSLSNLENFTYPSDTGSLHFWPFMQWIWRSGGQAVFGLLTIVFGLIMGLVGGVVEAEERTEINRGIWLSLRNGLRVGGIILVGICLTILLIQDAQFGAMVPNWLDYARQFILVTALILAYIFGQYYGVFAFLQHFLLRFFLWVTGLLPWDIPKFLSDADSLNLFHKTGYAFSFNHLVQKAYFESLGDQSSE